jgi:hypothetical protein
MSHMFADGGLQAGATTVHGRKGEWQEKFEKLQKIVKMMLRPALAGAQVIQQSRSRP